MSLTFMIMAKADSMGPGWLVSDMLSIYTFMWEEIIVRRAELFSNITLFSCVHRFL